MKILILSLLLSFNLFAQYPLLTLFDGERVYVYNGDELILNAIDRTLEPTSLYASNFGTNADGWTIDNGLSALDGNIDAIGGQDNTLRATSDNSAGAHNFRRLSTTIAGVRYKFTFSYYIPSANTTTKRLALFDGSSAAITAIGTTNDAWASLSGIRTMTNTNFRVYGYSATNQISFAGTAGDLLYIKDLQASVFPFWLLGGNHTYDSSSTYKQANSYSGTITASAAGDASTNFISLASARFTAVTAGTQYRFQLYAYTSTANTTLTFKLGDIVKTAIVSTVGMSVINFDFKATASTTGNILLYLDKAATVYIDEVSLKSGS